MSNSHLWAARLSRASGQLRKKDTLLKTLLEKHNKVVSVCQDMRGYLDVLCVSCAVTNNDMGTPCDDCDIQPLLESFADCGIKKNEKS